MQYHQCALDFNNDYNLNNVKEIKVSNEFLTLDKASINCQNDESLQDCKTRKYKDALNKHCKCLPFAIGNDVKVDYHFYLTKLTI